MKKVLVTGSAGFVGFHLSKLLAEEGYDVVGVDSVNDYYDVNLKKNRLKELSQYSNFKFKQLDLSDRKGVQRLFEEEKFDVVINLAAQAGVRYSLENPYQYLDSNITGFLNILEGCRHNPVDHLIFASTSSVYGANVKTPYHIDDKADHPISWYAATKKTNEAMAHSYASLYGVPTTGLRFFTVYGPWGRPDMAYFSFTRDILEGNTIKLFNGGNMRRDFTYVDDIVKSISLLIDKVPKKNEEKIGKELAISESYAPYQLFNIGNNKPVLVSNFVRILEELLGKKAIIENKPMQPGDMYETYADIDSLVATINYKPQIGIEEGLKRFVEWYKAYYKK